MVWVVDGMRYKRDLPAFREAVAEGIIIKDNPLYVEPLRGGTGIFRRWAPLQCLVFIDFRDEEFLIKGFQPPEPVLWQVLLHPRTRSVLIAAVTRASFIQFCLNGSPLTHLFVMRHQPRPPQPPARRYPPSRAPRFSLPRRRL
jgi:hypothetical protein